jgi:hypothetical protein
MAAIQGGGADLSVASLYAAVLDDASPDYISSVPTDDTPNLLLYHACE